MKYIILAAALCGLGSAASAEFAISFKWGNIPLCTTGNPNVVPNPAFRLTGLPEGTTSVQFKLVDLNVPGYNHGGSKKLAITKDGTVKSGTFKYKSPCPPNGAHTYQWTATARKGGKVLARAKAKRKYPE